MSITTPTTKDISDNIVAQMEAEFGQTIPLLQKSFMRVLAKVLAGVFVLLYKYGGFMFLQMFVQTASFKDTEVLGLTVNPLKFWGRLIGVGEPTAATSAVLTINVTVTNQIGNLPSGSQLVNSDNGVTYLTTTNVALSSATVSVDIIAASDQAGGGGAGVIGNLNIADNVSFANPLANVDRVAIVTAVVITGADGEAIEIYRGRIIDRFQKRPQGGAYSDYQIWAEEVEGIVNAYPYTAVLPGQVDVYVEATVASSGSADGIPTAPQLTAVEESIELDENGLASRRPANALVNVTAITRTGFDVEVTGLVVDNPGAVQADITAACEEYFLDREPYIAGLTFAGRKDRITTSAVGGVVEDIVSAADGIFTSVVVKEATVPVTVRTLLKGEKAKATTVIYI